jgi:TldD protein
MIKNERTSRKGISVRSFTNGTWGFASSENISKDTFRRIIQTAEQNAKYLKNFKAGDQFKLEHIPYHHHLDVSTKKTLMTQGDVISVLMDLDKYVETHYPDLKSRTIRLVELDMEKKLVNLADSEAYSLWTRSHIYLSMSTEKNGIPYAYGNSVGGMGDFEDYFENPANLYAKIDHIYKSLMDKTNPIDARAGIKDVIISSEITGILAHEAIGHTTEGDNILGGSTYGTMIGQQVANEKITLVDFANSFNGSLLPMPIFVDDEGTKATDAVIIENGILKGFMHNLETASKLGMKPTGNGRAFEFFDEPLVRMRNTAILPANDSVADMIASIEDGYYILDSSNGQADSTGEFMFGVSLGYEIKNGKLGQAIKETTVSGLAFDVLKATSMVGNDFKIFNNGYCGKKQWIPTADGGPSLKCRMNIGGK